MFTTISIVGLILAAVAFAGGRRVWPLLAVLMVVWGLGLLADATQPVLAALAWRMTIDFWAAMFVATVFHRDVLARWVVGFFILMLLNHAAFWLSRHLMSNDFWLFYAYSASTLWLGQMLVLAFPGGMIAVRGFGSLWNRIGRGLRSDAHSRGVVPAGDLSAGDETGADRG